MCILIHIYHPNICMSLKSLQDSLKIPSGSKDPLQDPLQDPPVKIPPSRSPQNPFKIPSRSPQDAPQNPHQDPLKIPWLLVSEGLGFGGFGVWGFGF